MMIGKCIFPPALDVWAANKLSSVGNTVGQDTKSKPFAGTSGEGFASAVANVTAAQHNYVLNVLTSQAILQRDQMLLPMHGPGASEATQGTFEGTFESPGIASPSTWCARHVQVDPYRATFLYASVLTGNLFFYHVFTNPGGGIGDSGNAYGDLGIPSTHALKFALALVVDDVKKDVFIINPTETRISRWGVNTATGIDGNFKYLPSNDPSPQVFCAHNGILLKACVTNAGSTRSLKILKSVDSGASLQGTIIIDTNDNTDPENNYLLDPVFLDWTPETATRPAQFVLVSGGGAVWTSPDGSIWTQQKTNWLPGNMITGLLGTLSSAAVVGDSIVGVVPRSDTYSGSAESMIYISDDWFGSFRAYPSKYAVVRTMARRLHYFKLPASLESAEKPCGYPFGSPASAGNASVAPGWATSQELTDPGPPVILHANIPALVTA